MLKCIKNRSIKYRKEQSVIYKFLLTIVCEEYEAFIGRTEHLSKNNCESQPANSG